MASVTLWFKLPVQALSCRKSHARPRSINEGPISAREPKPLYVGFAGDRWLRVRRDQRHAQSRP